MLRKATNERMKREGERIKMLKWMRWMLQGWDAAKRERNNARMNQCWMTNERTELEGLQRKTSVYYVEWMK